MVGQVIDRLRRIAGDGRSVHTREQSGPDSSTTSVAATNAALASGGMTHCSCTIRHLDMPPAFQGYEQHENIGGAFAFKLLIKPPRAGLAAICTRVSLISCRVLKE